MRPKPFSDSQSTRRHYKDLVARVNKRQLGVVYALAQKWHFAIETERRGRNVWDGDISHRLAKIVMGLIELSICRVEASCLYYTEDERIADSRNQYWYEDGTPLDRDVFRYGNDWRADYFSERQSGKDKRTEELEKRMRGHMN